MHLLSPQEAGQLWPLMDISDLVGAAFLPTDGQANPSDLTQALAKGARMQDVRIVEDVSVTAVRTQGGRVVGLATDQGDIACEKPIVNCAGQWAPEIGRMAGVNVPLQSMQHQYMITETDRGRGRPTCRPWRDPRWVDLLQGRGRRPRHGWLRTFAPALGTGWNP